MNLRERAERAGRALMVEPPKRRPIWGTVVSVNTAATPPTASIRVGTAAELYVTPLFGFIPQVGSRVALQSLTGGTDYVPTGMVGIPVTPGAGGGSVLPFTLPVVLGGGS